MEAKKIREQIEEEIRNKKRNEAFIKPMSEILYQNQRAKGLQSALLLTEVLEEREAQIEFKQRIKSATEDVEKMFLDVEKTDEEEAFGEEQKAKQRRRDNEAVAQDLKNQIREKEVAREQAKLEREKEAEEMQRSQELHQWNQRMESEKRQTQRVNLMQAHLEEMANRDLARAPEAQKEEAEEERRKLFLSAKQKTMKLHKEKEELLLQEAEGHRESVRNQLIVRQRAQTNSEDERVARAVAERDAKQAELQQREQERKAALLRSVEEYRKIQQEEKEQKDKADKQKEKDELQANKEKLRKFLEKEELKAEKTRGIEKSLQDFHASQMVENSSRREQLRLEEQEFVAKNAELAAIEDERFQQFSRGMISAAAEGQRNLFPLRRAAREGLGGVKPGQRLQDPSGAQRPSVAGSAEDIRKLHEAADIEEAKRRVGFTWQ